MTDIRATLTAKLAELDEEMAAMAKKPTEQGSIAFGKRIGEGTFSIRSSMPTARSWSWTKACV